MTKAKIPKLERKVARLLREIASLGPMRPGSISRQYRDRARRRGAYYQLSYTHKMKSRTEHVWPEHLEALGAEVAEFRRFKKLTSELVDASIELSKAKIAMAREHSAAK